MAYNSYLLPNFGGGSPYSNPPLRGFGGGSPATSPPMMTMGTGTGNVSARSVGTGFGTTGPDLSYADPNTLARLQGPMSHLAYNLQGGGYVNTDLGHYIGGIPYQGSDPASNRAAGAYYNYLGTLPTRTYGSLALERLYQSGGAQPNSGPSLNSMFGRPYQGPYGFDPNSTVGSQRY